MRGDRGRKTESREEKAGGKRKEKGKEKWREN